jgi:hypothetical protein
MASLRRASNVLIVTQSPLAMIRRHVTSGTALLYSGPSCGPPVFDIAPIVKKKS